VTRASHVRGNSPRPAAHQRGAQAAIGHARAQDQQLYRQALLGAAPGAPAQLTHVAGHRFADAAVDEARGRLLAVREDHTGAGEAVNTIVAVCAPWACMRRCGSLSIAACVQHRPGPVGTCRCYS